MIYRILSGIDPANYYLVNSRNASPVGGFNEVQPHRLEGQCYNLPPEFTFHRPNRFGLSYPRRLLNFFIHLYARTRNTHNILRQEPDTAAVIACSGDIIDIPAAFLASRIAGIPFYAYIFDDYVYQWTGLYRLFAQFAGSLVFKQTRGVIGPNEFLCDEYNRRYGVTATLVRNPCDEDELKREHVIEWPAEEDKIRIIYTGAIYHANYDCFRNLLNAMNVLDKYPLELHIFTAQPLELLRSQNITGEKVFIHSHVAYGEILEQQRKADILFLPLAFESPIPEVIRTSAPGKMGEYLASGRPILAHAPADSFVVDYCDKYNCAGAASQNDPLALAQTIRQLISDNHFRNTIIHNALERARVDFSPESAREIFLQSLESESRLQ